jgi:hypothetical protein
LPSTVRRTFGNAGCAAVEKIERLFDRLADFTLGGRADLVAPLEGGVDGLGELVRGLS